MENINKVHEKKVIAEVLKYRDYASTFTQQSQDEASKVDALKLNSSMYKIFLKRLILDKHLKFDDVKEKLPDTELVNKDENFSKCINYIFGTNELPMSFQIIRSLILFDETADYTEEVYYETTEGPIKAHFTVEELISSTEYVKKRKNQKNIKD